MINVINESFKNFPSWLKSFLSGAKYISQDLSNKFNVDLYNASVDNVSDPKDPRLRDTDSIVFVNLQSEGTGPRNVYVYKPVGDGKYKTINDVYITSQDKNASRLTNKKLLDLADNMAVLSISSNKKPKKDRYKDPRYDNGKYAGQTYYDYTKRYGYNPEEMPPGEWLSKQGRDKSGYAIPDPALLISKLYKFNVDNTAEVLDNYYKKISRIRDKIFKIDFRNMQNKELNGWNDDYSELLQSLAAVTNTYVRLEKAVKNALSRMSSRASGQDLSLDEYAKARGYTTVDELFQDILDWEGKYQIDLDKYLYNIQHKLRKVINS